MSSIDVERSTNRIAANAPHQFVLDTSLFTNPDTAEQFGKNAADAVAVFTKLVRPAQSVLRCYMPQSIYEELQGFVGAQKMPAEFELVIHLQSPSRYDVRVSGFVLYELIDDIRRRIDRGLRVAEKAVRAAHPSNVETVVNKLRGEYREVLRAGLLDSREDLDLILLARELDAALVSSDQGLTSWADRLGIRLIHPQRIRAILDELVVEAGSKSDEQM